jgi:hypothetical protein
MPLPTNQRPCAPTAILLGSSWYHATLVGVDAEGPLRGILRPSDHVSCTPALRSESRPLAGRTAMGEMRRFRTLVHVGCCGGARHHSGLSTRRGRSSARCHFQTSNKERPRHIAGALFVSRVRFQTAASVLRFPPPTADAGTTFRSPRHRGRRSPRAAACRRPRGASPRPRPSACSRRSATSWRRHWSCDKRRFRSPRRRCCR